MEQGKNVQIRGKRFNVQCNHKSKEQTVEMFIFHKNGKQIPHISFGQFKNYFIIFEELQQMIHRNPQQYK